MILLPPPKGGRPEDCPTCKATDRAGYCAPRRCYCRHTDCPAYPTTPEIHDRHEDDVVAPVAIGEVSEALRARRAAADGIPAQIRADLKARREARHSHASSVSSHETNRP